MMMKTKSNKQMKWNYAVAIPALFLAMVLLSIPKLNAKMVEEVPEQLHQTADSLQSKNRVLESKVVVEEVSNTEGKKPLYVVDGDVKGEDFDASSIKPDEIASISVLKGASATNLYGDKGKNGVIEITIKKK